MYKRTRKETHLDTIWYEIDMLEYCSDVLFNSPPPTNDPYWNLLIEGFLLSEETSKGIGVTVTT